MIHVKRWFRFFVGQAPAIGTIATAMVPDATGKIEMPIWKGILTIVFMLAGALNSLYQEKPKRAASTAKPIEVPNPPASDR